VALTRTTAPQPGFFLISKKEMTLENQTKYHIAAEKIADMINEKQSAYGDSFGQSGKVLELLYPSGVLVAQYQDMLCMIRIIDKLFRIANDKNAFSESPYADLAGYSLLGLCSQKD